MSDILKGFVARRRAIKRVYRQQEAEALGICEEDLDDVLDLQDEHVELHSVDISVRRFQATLRTLGLWIEFSNGNTPDPRLHISERWHKAALSKRGVRLFADWQTKTLPSDKLWDEYQEMSGDLGRVRPTMLDKSYEEFMNDQTSRLLRPISVITKALEHLATERENLGEQ